MTTIERRIAPPTAFLEAARRELVDEARAGRGGRAAMERFSDRLDALVWQLFAGAPSVAGKVAILALGGYGRRHLCLYSDVDLMILFEHAIGPEEEKLVGRLLTPLWDLGLNLGHQVRELKDFQHLEADNPEFLLALVDARPVAGDTSLFERFTAIFHQPETHAVILASLEQLITQRHAQFNDTLYQLEPDIKDAPGALRDLMALRVIGRLTDPALLEKGPAERPRVDEAEDFFFRLRSIIHLESKRNQNVLSHELQESAAQALGYEGAQPQQRVEHLMSDYFRHARTVSRSLDWMRRTAPAPIGVNLVRSRDGIQFVDARRAAKEPHTWLSIFERAIGTGAAVADSALTLIQQQAHGFEPDAFYPTPDTRQAVLDFLRPRAGLYARLTEMHDCGLLGRMFPEFQAISCRVVRDFYHKYTVDEHTLLTIRNLERLKTPSTPSRARFASLLADLESPELVVLALLFHDVGKWRDEDHHLESVRMAKQMFERLQLAPEVRETVEFLIQHHLQMSLVAFRRDTEDPEIVRRFAELVGKEERLKMLCLLTLADVGAVSPETLTPWREELLWRLYVDTYNHLTLQYGDDLIVRNQAELSELLAGRPSDVSETELTRFLEGFPRRYLQLFSRDAIYNHVKLSRAIEPSQLHATLERSGEAWELTVATLDKPGLFSNICGVLSYFGMDILRGNAFTNPNGLVLDIFQFTDQERFLAVNADGRERVLEMLSEVVSGRTDVASRLRAIEHGVLGRRGVPRFAPTIHCDNQSSRRYTILDIIANNAIGLLHRISRVISRHGCDVDLVLISTEGEKAIDVFHITQGGAKLSDAAQHALTADLARMLEGTDEAREGHRSAEQG